MTPDTPSATLDELCAGDPLIRNLLRIMRDGRGTSLDVAVKELKDLPGVPPESVDAAAARVRELMRDVKAARTPRAVVAGGIESWYPGPRAEDRNWASLMTILRESGWNEDAISQVDQASTKVVAQLPDPFGDEYQCRGLVLGYVQSGKTTNFTAVIAKAADAGYRFFIVLSGVHNGLRLQTQDRLNDQLWEHNPHLWHRLTDEDDFRPTANVDALLAAGGDQRVLAIVKKNGPRLRALKNWLFAAREDVLRACPLLIIDDEADQASVNTAKPEREPTRINGIIRGLLNGLPKSAYIGYTATPFANVLIDPKNYEDLFPRDFIVDLPRPDRYIGPEAIFGREPLEFDPDGDIDEGHDFVRSVPDEELPDLRPKGAKARHEFEPEVTDSLDAALRYFLLSTAARRARNVGNPHATALVHTSQFTDVHMRTAEVIRSHLTALANRVARGDGPLLNALEAQWEEESTAVPADAFAHAPVPWETVSARLPAVASDCELIVDNSRSDVRLEYDDTRPRVIVAVGGNTLSRGLTLEGLSVSFFVRTASAYDTLLQMGRWFGYRNGYADLTRIWMTDDMREWFHHLATVEQEIRYDVARYEVEHVTPEQLAPRIRTHPKLAVTAAAKMQHAVRANLSYDGRRLQTILFNHRNPEWLGGNIDAVRSLVGRVAEAPRRTVRPGIVAIGPVPSDEILHFLKEYRFHENSRDLDSKLMTQYISERLEDGELTHFSIAIMARDETADPRLGSVDLGLGRDVRCINRARLKVIGGPDYADIKALMGSADRVIDLDVSADELQGMEIGDLGRLRNSPERGGRGDGGGLLAIYPISKDSLPSARNERTRAPLDAVDHVVGIGMVFPEAIARDATVEYMTADVDSMVGVEVEMPEEQDELEEPEVEAA